MDLNGGGNIARRERRRSAWPAIEGRIFDVAVVGGGINGASAYHELGRRGCSAVLLEKGDFASGTSQASAMMVWGGLLYLRHWDLTTVRRLCAARDRMIDEQRGWVRPTRYRYMPQPGARHRGWVLHAGLHFYWLFGGGRRERPRRERSWPEQAFLRRDRLTESFVFEDASLGPSDARFVLRWVLSGHGEARVPLNYCGLEGGGYDHRARCWRLEVHDAILDRPATIRARCVVNAAGVWTDEVNRCFGRRTPYRHVLSKGVSIGLRRDPRLTDPLVFDTEQNGDSMVLIPWGPIALWGSTETVVDRPEAGFGATPEDVRSLLEELNRNLSTPVGPADIVSVRTGVRPLAARHGHAPGAYTLGISRRPRVHLDEQTPWVSVYGGKITDCIVLAEEVAGAVERVLGRPRAGDAPRNGPALGAPDGGPGEPVLEAFPGLREPVPGALWCAEHEMCWTLEDHLRRRTNIAQWLPRGGLGTDAEHEPALLGLAAAFADGNGSSPRQQVERYKASVRVQFDDVVAGC